MYHVFSFDAFDGTISGTVDVGDNFANTNLTNLENLLQEEAKKFEKVCSRFDPESELNKLNKNFGYCSISDTLLELLTLAKEAYTNTNEIFDPTIIKALENIGYNKSFSQMQSISEIINEKNSINLSDYKSRPKFSELIIDKDNSQIYLPPNMQIDLGGIAKGFWVDKMMKTILVSYKSAWLSAGGDIYIRGSNETNNFGKILIQDPTNLAKNLLSCIIDLEEFGVATSGIAKRQGRRNGKDWHHIINPQTGLSAKTDLLSATVLAKNTTEADVYAKTAIILGSQQAERFLRETVGCEYILINKEKKVFHSENLTMAYVKD
ncbi:MAG TPA: hypothetical protein DEB09_04035 [Candidatus Magasanikbacteria bacterium]|nr:hypothetical protein [Candidatus Magasanikbacteria bacterium]